MWLTVRHFTVSCIDAATARLFRTTQPGLAATAFRILDSRFWIPYSGFLSPRSDVFGGIGIEF
jgi:hypothetical protein